MSLEYCLNGNRIEHGAVVDLDKLRIFQQQHDAHIVKRSPDPIFGHAYSFLYKPCSIGTMVEIICECGEKEDITDMSSL